jgi:beta-galactosidase/beta-glucuronidase
MLTSIPKIKNLLSIHLSLLVSISLAVSNPSSGFQSQWRFKFVGSDSSDAFSIPRDLDSTWSIVNLPHTFNRVEEFNRNLQGIGWYYKEITFLETDTSSDYYLSSQGVCLRSQVFVNGILTGGCDFAYLPFEIKLRGFALKAKSYRIAVRVDNRLRTNDIPDIYANGWWLYGGLFRGMTLVKRKRNRLENIQVRTKYISRDAGKEG